MKWSTVTSRGDGPECDVTVGMGQSQYTAEKELVENGGQSATEAQSRDLGRPGRREVARGIQGRRDADCGM